MARSTPTGGAGQQDRIGILLGVGAEPLGERVGDDPLDHGHVRGLGGPQVRVAVRGLHPAQPGGRVAAEVPSSSATARASSASTTRSACRALSRRGVDEARSRSEAIRSGLAPNSGSFLGREVIEERARRHVRRLGDVLDRDCGETPLGDQVERTRRSERRVASFLRSRSEMTGSARGSVLVTVMLLSMKVCAEVNVAVASTLHCPQRQPSCGYSHRASTGSSGGADGGGGEGGHGVNHGIRAGAGGDDPDDGLVQPGAEPG